MDTNTKVNDGTRKARRMAICECLDFMWREFSEIVPPEDQRRISVFLTFKGLGHKILSLDAGDDTPDP